METVVDISFGGVLRGGSFCRIFCGLSFAVFYAVGKTAGKALKIYFSGISVTSIDRSACYYSIRLLYTVYRNRPRAGAGFSCDIRVYIVFAFSFFPVYFKTGLFTTIPD